MQRILFIINPKAGSKRKERFGNAIRRYMDGSIYAYEIEYTTKAGDASVMARAAADKGYFAVVAVGGDGTVNEVGCGLVGSGTALGILPCGSGDGLALHIGMSRNPAAAVKSLNAARVVDVDYCTVNGHPFFCTCGVGFDAFISWKFSEAGKRGLVTYMKEAFQNWAGYSPVCYEIETDETVRLKQSAVLITCANAAQWGNNARIAPHASLTDGLLDVTVVDPLNVLQAGPVAVHLMGGTLHWSPLTKMFKCRSLIIRRPVEGPAHFDGEPMMLGTELEVKVIPEGLKMLVPARKKNI